MKSNFFMTAANILLFAGLSACATNPEGEYVAPQLEQAQAVLQAALERGTQQAERQGQPEARADVAAEESSQRTDRIIVHYVGEEGPMSAAAAIQAARVLSVQTGENLRHVSRTRVNGQVVGLDEARTIDEINKLADKIRSMEGVASVEPDRILAFQGMTGMVAVGNGSATSHAQGSETAALRSRSIKDRLWHYYEPVGGINLQSVPREVTGKGVVIAVLDTGYRPHPDLNKNLNLDEDFDFIMDPAVANDGDGIDDDAFDPGDKCGILVPVNSFHGSHVAGTAAAAVNKKTKYRGVAPEAKILPLRVLGKCGGYTSDIVNALYAAIGLLVPDGPEIAISDSANVINASFGGFGDCNESLLWKRAIAAAREKNVTIVVAAGNDNDTAHQYTPASCPGVITVAATTREGARAKYSNFDGSVNVIDIAAPGGEVTWDGTQWLNPEDGILSTLVNDDSGAPIYAYKQGTSMATPLIAGVVALLYQVNPELTPDKVLQILQETARPFPTGSSLPCKPSGSPQPTCGAGIVDAAAAVQKAMEQ